MKRTHRIAPLFAALALLTLPLSVPAQTGDLPRATPESQGVPSEAVAALLDSLTALPRTEMHAIMVLRHGRVIAEAYPAPFAAEYRHTLYSASKTFTAAAVGLAVYENRLRLTDRVAALFPDRLPESVSPELAAMTVRDLLTMTSGITPDWVMRNLGSDWIRTYLAKPVKQPGEAFEYDSICTYLLSAIIRQVTGMQLLDYLKLKLFDPMHITEVAWEVSPEGYNTGGWGLHIQCESMAKFGQLLLDGGRWEGRQLLPEAWVAEMTALQQETGGEGYGYQTWLCDYPGAVRADGAYGQTILVIPDKDMVVAYTQCTTLDALRHRQLVWRLLLPEVREEPLAEGKGWQQLERRMAAYEHPVVGGKATAAPAKRLDGRTILLEKNSLGWKSIAFAFRPKAVEMRVEGDDGSLCTVPFGYRTWTTGEIDAWPPYSIEAVGRFTGLERPFHVAGSYGWSGKTLRLKAHYVDWITSLEIALDLADESAAAPADGNSAEAPAAATLLVRANYSDQPFTIRGAFAE